MKKDLQLMGLTARKKSLSRLCLSLGNIEVAFLSGAMNILTSRFFFVSKYVLECEERITAVRWVLLNSLHSEESVSNK